jgi:hypothetical protein
MRSALLVGTAIVLCACAEPTPPDVAPDARTAIEIGRDDCSRAAPEGLKAFRADYPLDRWHATLDIYIWRVWLDDPRGGQPEFQVFVNMHDGTIFSECTIRVLSIA